MQLYTILFDDIVSPESRISLANFIESLHWEVNRKWIPADPYSGNLNIDSLEITNWYEPDLPVPNLPSGCLLKKL